MVIVNCHFRSFGSKTKHRQRTKSRRWLGAYILFQHPLCSWITTSTLIYKQISHPWSRRRENTFLKASVILNKHRRFVFKQIIIPDYATEKYYIYHQKRCFFSLSPRLSLTVCLSACLSVCPSVKTGHQNNITKQLCVLPWWLAFFLTLYMFRSKKDQSRKKEKQFCDMNDC